MKAAVLAILRGCGEIFFIPSALLGAALLAAALADPPMAAAGALCVAAAYGTARLMRMQWLFLESGAYSYNPLLTGLALGYWLAPSLPALLLVLACGAAVFALTTALAGPLWTHLRLPVLSVPFVIVAGLACAASYGYFGLHEAHRTVPQCLAGDFGLPFWLAGWLRTFGAILFLPFVPVGVALALVLLAHSRLLFLLATLGYFAGTLARAALCGSAEAAFADPAACNFLFAAMAVGGVFLLPSLASFALAALTAVLTAVTLDASVHFLPALGIPVLVLPFNLVTLAVIGMLVQGRCPLPAAAFGHTPEQRLSNHLASRRRYTGQERTLFLPFSGRWTVWQGCNGRWTHQGIWRHAYDFVITGEDGKTHAGDGTRLTDYHGYRKPVLAPVRGRVVQVVDGLPDSPPGTTDEANKWGNLVVIQEPRGFCVELSHFAEKSVRVKVGDWIERGAVLGLCGNSGFSPQPHIHVQAQAGAAAGAATLPFSFVAYVNGGEYHANELPAEAETVEPLYTDKRLDAVTSFVLDEEFRYAVRRNGRPVGELTLTVRMAADGTLFLQSRRGRLYFGKHEGTFYCYRAEGRDRWLERLFLALPRMPLACRPGLAWHDHVPAGLVLPAPAAVLADFCSAFRPALATVRVRSRFTGENRVESELDGGFLHPRLTASVELDRRKGFAVITVGNLEFRLVEPETAAAP